MSEPGRLLLLEFVTEERWVYDSRFYPFVKGAADAAGFQSRWLTFGSKTQLEKVGPQQMRETMAVADEDLATLRGEVERLKPTHVIFSHPLSDAVVDVLRQGEDTKLLCTSDHPAPGVESMNDYPKTVRRALGREDTGPQKIASTSGLQARTDWLLYWLGQTDSDLFDQHSVDVLLPAYDATMANAKAVEYAPHLLVLGGVTCDHDAPVKDLPEYADLDLSRSEQDFGCVYCTYYRLPTSDMAADPVNIALKQLSRAAEAAVDGQGRHRGVADLLDIRLLRHIDRFADEVIKLELPPTTFCFEPRVDRVLEMAAELRSALGKLAGKGHGIRLLRMGIENLSTEENRLFNKRITVDQVDALKVEMRAIAAEHPNFEYDPTWAYITCSPWTTLESMTEMVQRGIEREFEPLGIWLYTPLLFYRGSPVVRLAEAQGGILVDAFEDSSLLYEPSVNGVPFDSLMAWRFLDPGAAKGFALMVRFCAAALRHDKYPDTIFEGDPLYQSLLAAQDDGLPYDRPDLFALAALRAVAELGPDGGDSALLDAAYGGYRERIRELGLDQAPATVDSDEAEGDEGGSGGDQQGQSEAAQVAEQERGRAADLAKVLQAVVQRFADKFGDVTVDAVEPVIDEGTMAVKITIGGEAYELRLAAAQGRHFFTSTHFGVSYTESNPLSDRGHQQTVKQLIYALDQVASRHAPHVLPPTD